MCSKALNSARSRGCANDVVIQAMAESIKCGATSFANSFHDDALKCITTHLDDLRYQYGDVEYDKQLFTHTETYVMVVRFLQRRVGTSRNHIVITPAHVLSISIVLTELRKLHSLHRWQELHENWTTTDRNFERFWNTFVTWYPDLSELFEQLGLKFQVLKSHEKHVRWFPVRVTSRHTGNWHTFKVKVNEIY